MVRLLAPRDGLSGGGTPEGTAFEEGDKAPYSRFFTGDADLGEARRVSGGELGADELLRTGGLPRLRF